ncbi:MAG: GDSL-type esterase/lipase family protein [Clostridia bacterium]
MKIFKLLSQKNSNIKDNGNVTAAFLGDSITHGAFEFVDIDGKSGHHIYDYDAVYHAQLKRMFFELFPVAPLNTVNAGIAGTSTSFGLKRIERDVLRYSPDLVVVCFGLNDAFSGIEGIEVYADALRNIFMKLKDANIEMIFMTPNMMNTYISPKVTNEEMLKVATDTEKIQNSGLFDKYIDAARKVCREENVPICDCYEKWKTMHSEGVDTTELLANHINHPNREMHKLFAQSLYDMIIE